MTTENERPLDTFGLTNYNDTSDRGTLVPPVDLNNVDTNTNERPLDNFNLYNYDESTDRGVLGPNKEDQATQLENNIENGNITPEQLPENSPIQQEAEQLTDSNPHNDEVKDEAVEDFIKQMEASSQDSEAKQREAQLNAELAEAQMTGSSWAEGKKEAASQRAFTKDIVKKLLADNKGRGLQTAKRIQYLEKKIRDAEKAAGYVRGGNYLSNENAKKRAGSVTQSYKDDIKELSDKLYEMYKPKAEKETIGNHQNLLTEENFNTIKSQLLDGIDLNEAGWTNNEIESLQRDPLQFVKTHPNRAAFVRKIWDMKAEANDAPKWNEMMQSVGMNKNAVNLRNVQKGYVDRQALVDKLREKAVHARNANYLRDAILYEIAPDDLLNDNDFIEGIRSLNANVRDTEDTLRQKIYDRIDKYRDKKLNEKLAELGISRDEYNNLKQSKPDEAAEVETEVEDQGDNLDVNGVNDTDNADGTDYIEDDDDYEFFTDDTDGIGEFLNSNLPALNLQDYHKDVALDSGRELDTTETDDVEDADYRVVEDSDFVPPTYTIDDLDREIEEVSQWPVTNAEEAKAKQNKLKKLKARRVEYGNASTSNTSWNYDKSGATGGRASPRAGIGSIGGAAGHGSMAATSPTKVVDNRNSIASKAPLPHALEDNQGRVVSVNGKATTAPSSNNNGAFRSGSFGLMSKASSNLKSIKSKAPVSGGPKHTGSSMNGTGMPNIDLDDGKQALIERLKQLLAQLTDDEKRELGFSPALNQWNGKSLNSLDGYTLQDLIDKVEERLGENE